MAEDLMRAFIRSLAKTFLLSRDCCETQLLQILSQLRAKRNSAQSKHTEEGPL